MMATISQSSGSIPVMEYAQQPSQAGTLKEVVQVKLKNYIRTISKIGDNHVEMIKPYLDNEESSQLLGRLVRDLKTIQLHFAFTSEVLEAKSNEEIIFIKQKCIAVSNNYSTIYNSSDVSLVPTNSALNTIVKNVISDLEKIIDGFFLVKSGKKEINKDTERIAHMQIVASKLETIIEYFPKVVSMDKDELFSQPKSSAIWQKLYQDTDALEFEDMHVIQESITKFCSILTIANAVIYKTYQVQEKMDNKILARLVGALSGVYYTAQHEKAETIANLLFSNPKMDSAFDVWNLPDNKFVKELYKLRLPPIEYDTKIYVQRLFPAITKESILKEYRDNTLNKITPNKFTPPNLKERRDDILKTLFQKDPSKVKIRILSSSPLVIKGALTEKMKRKMNEFMHMFVHTSKPKIDGVIIHVHGGGFVSMSSSAHRNYLIRWANSLNMVIFSIDYRLAPGTPYPGPLDDIWQAYNWLINYSECILGIPLHKIVLTGDSAGGNLVTALTLRIIKEGVRIPDGCLLSYPALNLYPERFVPSYFIAVQDVILPYNVLKLCLKAYIPEEFRPESDPFLSPIVASDELLSKLPPIRIVSGTNDPLHDDIWKFLQRLQRLGKDAKVTVYQRMPHGFLSFDEMKGYDTIVADAVAKIRELFQISEKGI